MFSSRFHWDFQPNRLTSAVAARRAAGLPVLDLTQSNPTHAGLDYPSAIAPALAAPGILRYEPAAAGSPAARDAVAAYYASRGVTLDPASILLTASTSEAYAYLFKLLTDPGDEVLVPRPSYPLFEFLATMESVAVRPYSLHYGGSWSIDFASLDAALTARTRAIVLVNPNNPTGSYVKNAELENLARVCRERRIALISDEVFYDYPLIADPSRAPSLALNDACLTFTMSGLSKAAGLPQMKLGWIVVSGPAPERQEAWDKLEWIADTYLSVSTPVQLAAPALLAAGEQVQRQICNRTAAHLQLARETFAGTAASLLHVEGGWYVIVQVPRIRNEEEWTLHVLDRTGVLLQPGYFYDFESEAFLVVSLLTAPSIFERGIAALLDSIR